MASPSPVLTPTKETEPRQQRRQQRIQEKRQQLEAQRRSARRRKLLLAAAGLIGLVALAAWFLFLRPAPIASPGHEVPIEGIRQHIPDGQPITYKNRPPTSGNHYANTSGYGFFQREISAGNWVHTLEHGGVVILYRPDLCDQDCQGQLQTLYNQAPSSSTFHQRKMAVIPYQDMDHAIAATAWGWLDEMDQVNADELMTFYRAHLDQGPEQAL